ncbi:hypothetical protein FGIG_02983 [Fasciola gigantica]|uniref:O-acyltransferase WSD1 C-terminal domain-containing protein n=1 Tax=Fasciola gigantica TaxID=46835 RepID=A0A504Y7R4_FASGI|nr:hypothetical protein FGIG_02983 [Fasciola gigantica]
MVLGITLIRISISYKNGIVVRFLRVSVSIDSRRFSPVSFFILFFPLPCRHQVDGTEPSDAESAAESDDPDSHRDSGSWVVTSQSHNVTQSPARKRPRTTRPMADLKVPSSSGLVCQRSGSAGVGSLLVFRLHAALSDDGKALVHMLTSCLADFPSHTPSPSCTPNRPTAPNSLVTDGTVSGREQTQKRRWRGQIHVDKSGVAQIQGGTSSTDSSDRVISAPGTKSSTKPSVPIRSYTTMADKQARPISTSLSDSGSTSTTDNNNSVNGMNNFGSVTMKSSVHVRGPTATNGESSSLLHSSSTMENGPAESSQIVRQNQSVPLPEDEDPEESEAAQWWYTFWSSSLATIATCCDLVRALLTGPAIILHKYFFTRADMGILTKRQLCTTTNLPSVTMTTPEVKRMATTRVYKCALLSLVKLSRVRQVTKASYSEIVLSLLAGGLRAYHQTVGLKHPPDLLSFLSVEVPVLPSCTLNSSQRGSVGQQLGLHRCDGSPCPGISRLIPGSQRFRISQNGSNPSIRHPQSESVVETGLIGNEHRMVAIGTLPTTANTLRPGRHVLADICLPINTEGMLPRLWETRQRLVELNNSVDPLCLAWARTVLYTIMPHPMAGWLEANFGGSSKASVSFTGVEVVSPFSGHPQPKEHDLSATYQMPPTRRLAYMSLLASKSAEARTLRRRLRRRLPRGALVCPPRLGTSFRALARHLTNANAGLVYIAGSPVIRIDTWMPSPRLAGDLAAMQSVNVSGPNTDGTSWALCRDLSVTFTTYAGQLSLTFCANSAMDSHPNLDLILQAMRTQLRKMCRLLAGRHVPTPTDRWLYRSSSMDTRSPSPSTALSLSPSLNPSLVLHTDSNPATDSSNETRISARSVDSTGSYGQFDPGRIMVATPVSGGSERNNPSKKQTNRSPPFDERLSSTGREAPGPLNNDASLHSNQALTNQISFQAYACQSGQPTEQLQDRLQWVQQQLNDAASSTPTHPGKKRLTDQELTDLRKEFCALLRELKQRCSLGSLGITPEMAKTVSASLTTSLGSPDHETLSGNDSLDVVHSRSSGFSTSRSGPMKFGLGEMSKTRGVDREPGQTSECSSVASTSCGKSIGIKKPSIGLEFGTDTKRTTVTPAGGDFDEASCWKFDSFFGDPDFYIDAYGDDEEFEEDEMSDGLEESTEPPFAVQSSGLRARPPVSPLTSERLGGKAPLGSHSTAIRIESMIRDRRDLLPSGADSYRTKSKWRRTSATPTSGARKRRRSSLLSADVANFDLIPTRRGSLGSGGTCSTRPGQDGLLSKLVKRKLGALIIEGSKSRRT